MNRQWSRNLTQHISTSNWNDALNIWSLSRSNRMEDELVSLKTRGKEILVFTCNPGHAHKRRTYRKSAPPLTVVTHLFGTSNFICSRTHSPLLFSGLGPLFLLSPLTPFNKWCLHFSAKRKFKIWLSLIFFIENQAVVFTQLTRPSSSDVSVPLTVLCRRVRAFFWEKRNTNK